MNVECRTKVSELIAERYSPYDFSGEEIPSEDIKALLDAARMAPSSYNEQPWKFYVGFKDDKIYNALLDALFDSNKTWAAKAPVLLGVTGRANLSLNGKKNNYTEYDVGQAVAFLTLEATEREIYLHQMGGFDRNKFSDSFNLNEEEKPVIVIALGYKDENNPRRKGRKELKEIVVAEKNIF